MLGETCDCVSMQKPHNFMSAESQDFAATVLVAQQDGENIFHELILMYQDQERDECVNQ